MLIKVIFELHIEEFNEETISEALHIADIDESNIELESVQFFHNEERIA